MAQNHKHHLGFPCGGAGFWPCSLGLLLHEPNRMSAHTARDTLVLVLAHDRAKFGVLNSAFHG